MKQKQIWMALVTGEGEVVFNRICQSKERSEKAIVDYLCKREGFDGKIFTEACSWIGEKELRLNLTVFEMEARDFELEQIKAGLFIEPPPNENDAYRVVYVIDIVAGSAIQAARLTHQIMIDPDSLPPVLEVVDQCGKVTKIDLSGST